MSLNTTPPKIPNTLRLLHTADWHLGKRLADQTRYEEFGEFLDWLIECIKINLVDVLIVAGDIFDTMTPSNKAQELYYQFLSKLAKTSCRHAVIIAGNHDSPSLLDAPKNLLAQFNVHLVGTMCQNPSDELLVLNDKDGNPILIVAAVPYLREKDVRSGTAYDNLADKELATIKGIQQHYTTLATLAKSTQQHLSTQTPIPIVATGHLFAIGATVAAQKDGMRNLYVGTLGACKIQMFEGFDYVALGHIHKEQMVGKQPHIRYSGSPMPFCFDEQNQHKKVLLVDFDGTAPTITPIVIPVFRQLYNLIGDFDTIKQTLINLTQTLPPNQTKTIWLNVECSPPVIDLKTKLDGLIKDLPFMIVSYQNKHKKVLNRPLTHQHFSLKEMTPTQVFDQLLNELPTHSKKKEDKLSLSDQQKTTLKTLYEQILFNLETNDTLAQ